MNKKKLTSGIFAAAVLLTSATAYAGFCSPKWCEITGSEAFCRCEVK